MGSGEKQFAKPLPPKPVRVCRGFFERGADSARGEVNPLFATLTRGGRMGTDITVESPPELIGAMLEKAREITHLYTRGEKS